MNNAHNKKVLVTGCSSGIGYDCAHQLHQRGYQVIASCRRMKDVERLRAENLNCIQLDIADSTSIATTVNMLRDSQADNPLYGIVNNAAFGVPGAVEDISRNALREQFETNVFGTHELTCSLIPLLREHKQGRIIQISSILGGLCLPFRGAYNASKYALEALSDTLRLELSDTDIHVSLIQPGPIDTEFRANAQRMYEKHVQGKPSAFAQYYSAVEARLSNPEPVKFTLPASAVSQSIIHALESKRPKVRYRVTVPTRLFLPLKRLLPDRLMDALLLKVGDQPKSD